MHCGSEISAGYTGWTWKSLIFAKMNPDWHHLQTPFWGQYRSLFVFATFCFFFFVHQCAFHLLKIDHNTNGSFRSFLLVGFHLRSNRFDRQKKICTIISFLDSYCNFLDLIFTWAVKRTACFLSLWCVCVCVCVRARGANLQAYGLWNILSI